jgi:hypothetical protein
LLHKVVLAGSLGGRVRDRVRPKSIELLHLFNPHPVFFPWINHNLLVLSWKGRWLPVLRVDLVNDIRIYILGELRSIEVLQPFLDLLPVCKFQKVFKPVPVVEMDLNWALCSDLSLLLSVITTLRESSFDLS